MTNYRNKIKGADRLHLEFIRIEKEFDELLRFYDFIDSEIKSESQRIEKMSSDSLSFDSVDEENYFYSMIGSDSDSFNEYFPQVSMKYAFIGMFGLFENYFKKFILISRLRIRFKGITRKELLDKKISDDYKLERQRIKKKINETRLYDLKNEFICETKQTNINFSSFDNLWSEFSKFIELRNAIIHNDSDVTKIVGNHWKKIGPNITNLEQFIYEFFNEELFVLDNKFFIKDKEFLLRCKSLYLKLLEEKKKIIIN